MGKSRRKGIEEGFANERLLVVPPARLKQIRTLPVLRDLRVTDLGLFSKAENHLVVRRGGAPEFILIYCLAGRGGGQVGGKSFALEAGDLVLLPPNVSHRYFADETLPWTIFWFHFTGERAADYVRALGMESGEMVLHAPRIEEMQRAFEETYQHALDGFTEAGLLGMATGFMRMIGLFRRHSRSRNLRSRRAEDKVLQVVGTLQERLSEPWTVDQMAALAGMSPAHFTVRFKAQTGEAPLSYLIHQRMQRAAAMLQRGGGLIGEVAEAVGYDDAYYFSRLFRAVHGISPREYRKRLQGGG